MFLTAAVGAVGYDTESTMRYTYQYGANGQAAEVKDSNLGRVVRTEYDRQVETRATSTNAAIQSLKTVSVTHSATDSLIGRKKHLLHDRRVG